jgi:preprotein translocase subunit SecA
MINAILTKIVGSKNERTLKRIRPVVETINGFEPKIQRCRTTSSAARRTSFSERLAAGQSLDDSCPEAFAVVREAGRRNPPDAALRRASSSAGWCSHDGKIARCGRGEGKTAGRDASPRT